MVAFLRTFNIVATPPSSLLLLDALVRVNCLCGANGRVLGIMYQLKSIQGHQPIRTSTWTQN